MGTENCSEVQEKQPVPKGGQLEKEGTGQQCVRSEAALQAEVPGVWLCEGAAPRQVRGSCSPRSRPLQHLRAQNAGLSLIHGGPRLVPCPTPTPAGPLLFSFPPTQLRERLL